MKNVLYILYDGLTDPLGQSQVLPYLFGLSKYGYKFTVLSFEKKERFKKEKDTIINLVAKAGMHWVPLFFTSRPPVLAKMLDVWKMRRMALKLQQKHHFEILHCRSYVAAQIGWDFKKRFGTKFLFDMRGFWADERVENGQWNINQIFYRQVYRHYKKLENAFLLHADAIITLTEAAKKQLINQRKYAHLSIEVIPCCADLYHYDYHNVSCQKTEHIKNELSIPADKKIITYLGSVGGWYMMEEMFEFYKRLLLQYPEFLFFFITKDNPFKIRKQAEKAGIDQKQLIIRYCQRKELPAYLNISDCSIFFIRPTYSKIASSPTKHAELMGMGIPVICNDIGDTGNIIKATATGLLLDEFSDKTYDKTIQQLNTLLKIPKQNIRNAAFHYFDLSTGIKAYLNVYKKLAKNDSSYQLNKAE